MYKLIIADDESRIRERLKNIMNWRDLGFEVTDLFSDGQEIIEYLDYIVPDVILTDIKMNHVSGLDLAKYVFEHKLPCKVVLISGYKEFELALQGMRYGAEDYLLKPIEIDRIREVFVKIRSQLDEKMAQQKKEKSTILLLEERFFANVVMGVVESTEYIRSCMEILYPEIVAEECPCFVADIYIEDYDHFMKEIWEYSFDQFEMNMGNFLKIYKNTCCFHIVYKADNLIEVIGFCVEKADSFLTEKTVQQSLKELVCEMEQNFRFQVNCKLRHIYSSIYEIGHARSHLFEQGGDDEMLAQYVKEQKIW